MNSSPDFSLSTFLNGCSHVTRCPWNVGAPGRARERRDLVEHGAPLEVLHRRAFDDDRVEADLGDHQPAEHASRGQLRPVCLVLRLPPLPVEGGPRPGQATTALSGPGSCAFAASTADDDPRGSRSRRGRRPARSPRRAARCSRAAGPFGAATSARRGDVAHAVGSFLGGPIDPAKRPSVRGRKYCDVRHKLP